MSACSAIAASTSSSVFLTKKLAKRVVWVDSPPTLIFLKARVAPAPTPPCSPGEIPTQMADELAAAGTLVP